ncbi:hypothetical protein ACOSP7_023097 [Xanthoceras sorbifolium]|uniref:Precursor of CEP9 n=1 Tax=Xanthoceras sorbifolium TaxID=99658 RepID=A0ABQ8HQC3_9ROSI|nr:hypothetical protein JRO89_XS08G0184700 [Xanthoceras sorbifolium]
MAEIRSMYNCLILVALIACHAILSAEGRQMKSVNKKEANSGMGETAKQQGSSISINSPTMSFGDLKASYKDDFRPTTPGISPGAGHSFGQHQQNDESKLVADNSQKTGHSITGDKNDFRPTAPGHSPGVGHAIRNKSTEEPNA